MLPWFDQTFPLYLAPMAGVTDVIFRSICKELGADVMVTEFVSAEGILQRDDRTRKYTEFTDEQRPCGVQLFGANGKRMGEAAKKIIDWKQPEFIDINFGCPVNKVVAKNGGSSLLKDCGLLENVARDIYQAVGDQVPVTAKIRIGWDHNSINAPTVCQILEQSGIQAIAIHGRTRSQKYTGEANWTVIDECARTVTIPIIGNGDITSGEDVERHKKETAVSGVMIGRAAMQNPWVFREAKHYLQTGQHLPPAPLADRWALIHRHCKLAIQSGNYGDEAHTMQAMRSRLIAYCKGFPGAKQLRQLICQCRSFWQLEDIANKHLHECLNQLAETI